LFLLISGCDRSAAQQEVVLYTSVDEPIASPIIRDFEKQSGIRVRLVTDSEASKSVGLAEKVRAERADPQADVFWSNEPFHAINLAEEGVLTAYESPAAADVPARFKDPQHRWTATGIRVRVLAVALGQPFDVDMDSIERLTAPKLKDHIAIARPTAGTTGGHVAALYLLWGDDRADQYFRNLHDNGVKLLGGNSVVAEALGNGTMWAGLTDNDDVASAQAEGGKLKAILPDQSTFGTLAVPTTLGLVSGAKHDAAARKLIDFLLSPPVEQKLIDVKFAAYSVRAPAARVKFMDVDYAAVAKLLPQAVRRSTAILEGRDK
jgi:iron(III) transport system substrate-binding protein